MMPRRKAQGARRKEGFIPLPLAAKSEKAFTFIEIIAVVAMIAIISVIIFNRIWFDNFDLIAANETIKAHLRYAQSKAMNSDSIWGIRCDGTAYWLFKNGDIDQKVLLPGEHTHGDTAERPEEEKAKVFLSDKNITSMEVFTLSFDDRGIPHTDATASDGMELTSADPETLITVSSAGESQTIVITPNTGFIP